MHVQIQLHTIHEFNTLYSQNIIDFIIHSLCFLGAVEVDTKQQADRQHS